MENSSAPKKQQRWPVYVGLALLVIIGVVFVVMFVLTSEDEAKEPEVTLTADTYAAEVAAVLAVGDAAKAPDYISKYGCLQCHGSVAPNFIGLWDRAATRRPPLTAQAYVYESITHPNAFIVEGYPDLMPRNFRARMTDEELGSIIAYLLTPRDE